MARPGGWLGVGQAWAGGVGTWVRLAAVPVRERLLWALAGLLVGFFASVVAYGLVAAIGGYEIAPEVGRGLGRATMQATLGEEPSAGRGPVPIVWLAAVQIPLWGGLIGAPLLARRAGLDWRAQLGWRMQPHDVGLGAAVGIALQFVILPVLYRPIRWLFGDLDVGEPARALLDQVDGPVDVMAVAAMTVVGASIAEEIFYRGLLQGALSDRLGPAVGIGLASVAFAASHAQLVQFPALLVVGVVNGLLVWRTGRLGPAVWSHVSFNAVTVVSLLAR